MIGDETEPPLALKQALLGIRDPAYLLDRHWRARAWNAAATELFVGWLDDEGAVTQRNLMRYLFLTAAARQLVSDWPDRARRVVSEFRADHSHALDDPDLRQLLGDLRRGSPDFATLWDEQLVLGREGGSRHFTHPKRGSISYEQLAFAWTAEPGVKLIMLVPTAR